LSLQGKQDSLSAALTEFQSFISDHVNSTLETKDAHLHIISKEKSELKLELQTKEWTIQIIEAENERLNELLTEKEKEITRLKRENLKLLAALTNTNNICT